jgi:RNA polymerase sigma-70 factor (ECF subfamily)
LDEKHRIPIILRYYHDLPAAEIAEMLGIPVGTVHSRLNHARERLRTRLEEER